MSGRTSPLVRTERLWRRLNELARISADGVGVTRPFPSPAYLEGRRWLMDAFRGAGLATSVDHAGNLHGRLSGHRPDLVILGGHSDTVPHGGAFDGALGVLGGLEIAQALAESGQMPEFTIDVMDCLAEEPSVFGLSCIGSRGFAGRLKGDDLSRRDAKGVTLADAVREVGGDPDRLGAVDPQLPVSAYLELHIEQGPLLETTPGSLGVVTAIVGIVRHRFTVLGRAAHAGTTPMAARKDAAVAAGAILTAIREEVSKVDGAVATIGELHLSPNVPNVIPGEATGVLEVRAADPGTLDRTVAGCLDVMTGVVRNLGCTITFEELKATRPTAMAPHLMEILEAGITDSGSTPIRLFSGGGHDAVEMSRRAPVGMLFSPCRDGVSHHPSEWVDEEDVDRAIRAYALAVQTLAHPQ